MTPRQKLMGLARIAVQDIGYTLGQEKFNSLIVHIGKSHSDEIELYMLNMSQMSQSRFYNETMKTIRWDSHCWRCLSHHQIRTIKNNTIQSKCVRCDAEFTEIIEELES